ncbi:glycoside hydrolase family 65 protein [Streptococcus cuniculi]|uniref:Glycoside hydrolase family 65 protein n=1 Tax=Streptococcus cuniculi TaxID=1432788 RepID=A0A4Y9JED7_9STRE|nr:glycosyl hydrolase family 65 protein [Streptococcus cuniculi]MBF0777319.1 glycoside hydrolase family 65 protein [Streptococcus cuniculi]TFU98921.1 glycoside hydrolase family 65 protein [Streptococcus cuniculi]
METLMHYSPDRLWQIQQKGFDQTFLGKTESIMVLGNGYMASRSSEEESYVGEVRDTFVAGTFNAFDENEVTELPNVPDMLGMSFLFNNRNLSLVQGQVSDYTKTLNLKTGELVRQFVWQLEDIHVKLTFRRFISKARRHFFASQVTIENLSQQDIKARIRSGINGQLSNEGSQHFTDGEKGLMDGRFIQMMPKTTQSHIQFVQTVEHMFLDAKLAEHRPETARRGFFMNYRFDVQAGKSCKIEKRGSIYTSIDNDLEDHDTATMRRVAVEELKQIESNSFDDLLQESAQEWEKIWNKHPIRIESSDYRDQLAIRFAQYHLHVMTPAHDQRMNIGAKGLSGEGYKGHTFWDTEIFMLPYFNFTHPEIAKSLVTYRYLGLEGARKKAASNGYEGAQYPWEAAWPTDGEVTPVWGAADIVTGQATKIWSGFIEQHITSDVAFGVKQYLDVTGDDQFAREKGYEILIDTAKFWASRLEYNPEKEVYEINDIIGPDEYKEHVNNNSYTNYTAHWNMAYVLTLIEDLKINQADVYAKLDATFKLADLVETLTEKSQKMFLPQPTEESILPQDDSYLSKAVIHLRKYKESDGVDSLFHDYNLDQVNEMQITKQADVLLLLLLFEGLFEKELKEKNFDYYEPKTTHDSSLSLSTHAILAADLGRLDQSYDFFKQASNIDMGEYMKSSDPGIHAASLGGIWQMVVFGYGGVRIVNGKLRIEPHLPKEWTSLDFGFDYQGQSVSVHVTQTSVTIDKSEGPVIEFINKEQTHKLINSVTINL